MAELGNAAVVIIGGGCIGTSAAYHLCKAGVSDVAVLEMGDLCEGATGRCGGGMRQQWSNKGNIILAKHSIGAFKNFADEMGQEIDFVQGGYLLPAFNDGMVAEFRKNIALQNQLGVPSRFITPDEIRQIAPILNTDGMLGAAYCATDGKSNPFLVVKGYAERAREMGARIHTRTRVTGFVTAGSRITTVLTDRGKIEAEWVINAAGAHAAKIAAMTGIEVPITPYRHQILVTEPVEPCFDPMFINLLHNIYFLQAKHGSFLIGQTDEHEVPGFNLRETWQFQVEIAKKIARFAPPLSRLQIVRQWAGHYVMTPDRQPIIDRLSEYDNLLIAAGYSGHGFMLSPASGKVLSELVTKGKVEFVDLAEYSIARFREGNYAVEKNVV